MVAEWKEKPLGVLADVKTGPFGSALHASDYVSVGTPIITVEHLGNNGVVHNNLPLVSQFDCQRLSAYSLRTGDIVFSRVGSVDRNAYVTDRENDWLFSGRLLRIRVTSNEVYSLYLSYYFKDYRTKNRIYEVAVGQTMASLNTKILNEFTISYPSLPAQRAIAAALSDADAYIAALEKLIAKKRNIKQGAMQELLTGKRRLPGFSGEWVECELGTCFSEIVGGGTPSRSNPEYWGNEIPWVTVKDYSTFNRKGTQEYITRKGLENSATNLIPSGIPIIPTRMGLGQIVIYDVDVAINQDLKALFYDSHIDKWFIVYWFRLSQKRFEALGTGSTVKGISINQLKEQSILLPPTKSEQTAVAEVLSDMDAEIDALTAKLNKARRIKSGMMSELLTGKIRLVEQDASVEAATGIAPKIKLVPKGHNKAIEDAVILAVVTDLYATEQFPLTPFYAQKFSYLLHRHMEGVVQGYHKLAAGPYNAELKYKTALPIAKKNRYVATRKSNYKGTTYQAMVVGDNIQQAKGYFARWHSDEPLKWLEQFRYIKNRRNELELLTTVDMAMVELREAGKPITVQSVKDVIQASEEWKAKLKRELFSDVNIERTIIWSNDLFS